MTTATPATTATSTPGRPSPDRVPWWRRARLWLALAAALIVVALLLAALSDGPGRALDPASASPSGSRALAHVAARFGIRIMAATSVADAARDAGAVVVTSPDDYSSAQLRRLRDAATLLVLVRPGTRATGAVVPGLAPEQDSLPDPAPDCAVPGAVAAGPLDAVPDDALAYRSGRGSADARSCYGGLLVVAGRVAVLGSVDLLTNDVIGGRGVAALDVNTISDGRRITRVAWLQSGSDAAGPGPASVWDLFPDGVHRAFRWLLVVGLLLLLWQLRRLGGVVREPLPVIVPAAEIVEGHGRLWQRARGRDRASGALRRASVGRLRTRLALPGADVAQLAGSLAELIGEPGPAILATLAGPVPADDAALLALGRELGRLERRAVDGAAGQGMMRDDAGQLVARQGGTTRE